MRGSIQKVWDGGEYPREARFIGEFVIILHKPPHHNVPGNKLPYNLLLFPFIVP